MYCCVACTESQQSAAQVVSDKNVLNPLPVSSRSFFFLPSRVSVLCVFVVVGGGVIVETEETQYPRPACYRLRVCRRVCGWIYEIQDSPKYEIVFDRKHVFTPVKPYDSSKRTSQRLNSEKFVFILVKSFIFFFFALTVSVYGHRLFDDVRFGPIPNSNTRARVYGTTTVETRTAKFFWTKRSG